MGLWSASLMPPTVTVNMVCHQLKKQPLWHFNFLLNLCHPSTHTHPIFLTHTDPHSQKNTQPNTHEFGDIIWTGGQPPRPDLPALLLAPSLRLLPYIPPQLKSVQVSWKAPNEHAQQTTPPPPKSTAPSTTTKHTPPAQQMSVTHWAVCGDYSLNRAKNRLVSR